MSKPVLVGLCGSLRSTSTNRKLLVEAARLFGPCVYTEADLNLPLYDGDLEDQAGIPQSVLTVSALIDGADAVILSTPEYNKGISGVLKNALDWISRDKSRKPWMDKPVAVMSAAAGRAGGERGQAMLRQCMVPFQPKILQGPEVHLAAGADQFDASGRLISEHYENTLTRLMTKLRAEIES